MITKGAVLHEIGKPTPYADSQPLKIEDLHIDPPGAGEVLVQVKAAGLCHSDLSVINGDRPRPTPMALGHEAAGEVLECGSGVTDLKAGDHVVMVFVPSCGHCLPCMNGRPALCEPGAVANGAGTLLSGARRLQMNGGEVHHHMGVSAFAQHAVCARQSLIKIDHSLPFEEAALFGCAVLTGVGAVVNTARIEPGATVAVIGLGGVGLNALLAADMVAARQIMAIDVLDEKLAVARQLGATDTFNASDPNCAEQVRDATGGGVDYAFEMAGSVNAMNLAYQITGRGGMTVTAGLSHPDRRLDIQHTSLVAEERTIKGSYIGSCVPIRDVPRYIALYQQGRLPVDRLMSATLGLEEINAGFDQLATGRTIRQVVVP